MAAAAVSPLRVILIGTHHKSGTVWMRTLFERIAAALGAPFVRLKAHTPIDLAALAEAGPLHLIFQDHAFFGDIEGSAELHRGVRGCHVIRDPRDLLISAANYHSWSNEAWLQRVRADLGDRSYQQALCALDFDGAVTFEMRHSAGRAIRDMRGFERGEHFFDIKVEDLMQASPDAAWAFFERLGFAAGERQPCLEAFEATRLRDPSPGLRGHVQNADCYQWRYMFDEALLATFRERCGDVAEALAYPPSSAAELRPDPIAKAAYLARFHANRGASGHALQLLAEARAAHPDAAPLLVAERLVVELESGS